jgi:hypothetical protein
MERTAARYAFTFQMIKTVPAKVTLGVSSGRSSLSR